MSFSVSTLEERFLVIPPSWIETNLFLEQWNVLTNDKITAFHGFSSFKGVTITASGVDYEGTLTGTLNGYSWEKIYEVYNLPSSNSWKLWGAEFRNDKNQSELKQTYNNEEKIDFHLNMKFKVAAKNLQGVTYLHVGFETLRLKLEGTQKDHTVMNPDSGGGKDQDGHDIPVDFKPV